MQKVSQNACKNKDIKYVSSMSFEDKDFKFVKSRNFNLPSLTGYMAHNERIPHKDGENSVNTVRIMLNSERWCGWKWRAHYRKHNKQ